MLIREPKKGDKIESLHHPGKIRTIIDVQVIDGEKVWTVNNGYRLFERQLVHWKIVDNNERNFV